MRTLQGSDRFRKGLMGVIVVALIIGVGSTLTSVPMLFAVPTYYGQFADTGGLNIGDKVRIAGMDVGNVKSMEIDGDKVVIGYTLGGRTIGTESRAAIRTDTILGRKNIEIEPRGSETLKPRGVLPVGQTSAPYQIYDAFLDVTRNAAGWDTQAVRQSLNVLSETVDQTSPHLSAALDGVARFSETIGKRDEDVKKLLASANKVATVLGDRSTQVNQLLVNAQTLLAAVNERGRSVSLLLERVSSVSRQVEGFVDENPNLNHVLEQLRTVSDVLNERKQDLADILTVAGKFITSLAEALASGPYFKVMLVNLIPPTILQPFVDAAFKKRGIDPEEFWRNAGLPAFRFPDPNGERHENGAPPAAPTPLEGTPERSGRRPARVAVLVHASRGRHSVTGQPAAVCASQPGTVRTGPRWLPTAERRHLGAEPRWDRPFARRAERGDPRSDAPGAAGCAGRDRTRSARCAHRPGQPDPRGTGLHAGHRAPAAGHHRSAATSGPRPAVGPGR